MVSCGDNKGDFKVEGEASEEVIGRRPAAVQCHELSGQRLGLTTAGKPNPDGIFVLGEKRVSPWLARSNL